MAQQPNPGNPFGTASSVPTSGDTVSQVDSDISKSLTLGSGVFQLGRQIGTASYNCNAAVRKVRADLGEWAAEASEGLTSFKQPILDTEEFEKHLDSHDAIFVMQRYCATQAPWAKLLRVLGIQPGMGTVRWGGTYAPRADEGIPLQMDGASLCHIINLYKYDTGTEFAKSTDHRRFDFDTISWAYKDGIRAAFESQWNALYGTFAMPFKDLETPLEKGTLWATYLNALDHSVSDVTYAFPGPDEPLHKRLAALLKLKPPSVPHGKSLLVSFEWLSHANRTRRRILTNGGLNLSFHDALRDDMPQEMHRNLGVKFDISGSGYYRLKSVAKFPLFSESHGFRLALWKALCKVFDGYEQEAAGSWKRALFDMRNDLQRLIQDPPDVLLSRNTWVLDKHRGSMMWKQRVLLR